VLRTRRNSSLTLGVENGPVLNFGLDSDLGIRISDFLTGGASPSGRPLIRAAATTSLLWAHSVRPYNRLPDRAKLERKT